MKHLHIRSNQYFEVGEYRDGYKTYDITVISYWKECADEVDGSPVEIVGYYFGGYDEKTIDYYIDKWIANRDKEDRVLKTAKDTIEAYLLTNEGCLEPTAEAYLQHELAECDELINDRRWKFVFKREKEWEEAEKIKKLLNDCMERPGDTSIKITIERDGQTTTADLYDHAALVTSLYESLEYFQSEL